MKLEMAAAAVMVAKGGRVSDGRVITKLPGNIVVVLVRWESSYFTRECPQKPNGFEGPTSSSHSPDPCLDAGNQPWALGSHRCQSASYF